MRAIYLSVLLAMLCLSSVSLGQGTERSASVEEDATQYANRWALIVGINYKDSEAVKILQNAENDAERIQHVLASNYGFRCEMLSGAAGTATRKGILAALDKYRDKSGPNDCFLFYFAGHGQVDGLGYVYPSDIQARGGKPDSVNSGILCADLVSRIRAIPCRHSLIVLDSCFSGSLLDHLRKVNVAPDEQASSDAVLPAQFRARALQAITSAAGDQKAADGERNSKNSPFAKTLLEALAKLGSREGKVFTLKQLMSYINLNFRNGAQEPQFSEANFDGKPSTGQFHFFVREPPTAPTKGVVFQTLPGTPGRWWFEEMPWLTPRARLVLDGEQTELRFLTEFATERDKDWLDPTPVSSYQDLKQEVQALAERKLQPPLPGQLQKLLQLVGPRDPGPVELTAPTAKSILSDVLSSVERTASRDAAQSSSASELHLKALLMHKLGDVRAEEAYLEAEQNYPDEQSGLRARCLADHGHWYLRQAGLSDGAMKSQLLEQARLKFQQALKMGDPKQISPFFEMELISAMALSNRRDKNWREAEALYEQASEVATEHIGEKQHPMQAYLLERQAWTYMDQWKVAAAEECFGQAKEIWETIDTKSGGTDFTAFLKRLQAEHGLAMASRLRGSNATTLYEVIRKQLRERLKKTDDPENETALFGQLINTSERLADCYLLGDRRGIGEAISAYDGALDYLDDAYREASAEDSKRRVERQLRCKMIIAATLCGEYREVEAALAKLDDQQDEEKTIYRVLAEAFAKIASETTLQAGLDEIRDIVRKSAGAELPRDHGEVLLLAAEVVSDQQRRQDAKMLERLVPKNATREAVEYFRDRYDKIIGINVAITDNPRDFRELVEFVQKVKKPEMKDFELETSRPFVVFYFPRSERRMHLLVQGDGRSAWQVRTFNVGIEDVQAGLREEQKVEINRFLAEAGVSAGAQVCWDDDVLLNIPVEYPFGVPEQPTLIRAAKTE